MKKVILFFSLLLILSCGTKKVVVSNNLFEVLTEQKDGGASIQFYEILTEFKEIKMLLCDQNLKNKIKESDIETSNFIIINIGFRNEGNNKIEIESVVETNTNIVIKLKEQNPKPTIDIELGTVNPYMILKINSKKEIIFK